MLFSYASALDLSGPQENTARIIRDFLQALGPYWIPLELSPWKIGRKENGEESSSGTPCVSESFRQAYLLELRDDVTNLGKVVDLMQRDRDTIRPRWNSSRLTQTQGFRISDQNSCAIPRLWIDSCPCYQMSRDVRRPFCCGDGEIDYSTGEVAQMDAE